jgi:hypothetical protein
VRWPSVHLIVSSNLQLHPPVPVEYGLKACMRSRRIPRLAEEYSEIVSNVDIALSAHSYLSDAGQAHLAALLLDYIVQPSFLNCFKPWTASLSLVMFTRP